MVKKRVLIGIFAATIIVFAALTPVTGANILSKEKNIPVTTAIYTQGGVEEVTVNLTKHDVRVVEQQLKQLNNALIIGDETRVLSILSFLKSKGLFRENVGRVNSLLKHSSAAFTEPKGLLSSVYGSLADENLSNVLCYINAVGRGLIIFTIGYLLAMLVNNGVVLPIQLYLLILVVTHLVPFRVLLPVGVLSLEEGGVSTFGLNGFQRLEVNGDSVSLVLTGFTGLIINIPFSQSESGPFLFLSGLSLMVKEGGLPIS
ncbi:MAG: hypothetical protein DRN01_02925 [Thermoplasmata archaeon]|nr:MAG: hypothetical protein DRN01_02925 [Thermoplasmata archaeon]